MNSLVKTGICGYNILYRRGVASPSLTCHGGKSVPRSLLIVDDSKSVRDAVLKALMDTGLFSDFFQAENGIKALDVLLKNGIDFIITDVIMPGVDGFKLVSTIKNQKSIEMSL